MAAIGWQAEHLMPGNLAHRGLVEQAWLRRRMWWEGVNFGQLGDLAIIGAARHRVLGNRIILEGQRECFLPEPDGGLLADQPLIPIEPPVVVADVAHAINASCAVQQFEELAQRGDIHEPTMYRPQDFAWAGPAILAVTVGVVLLPVVVSDKPRMDRADLFPARRQRKGIIGHPPEDVEVGLDIILPGLAGFDPLLADPQLLINRQGGVGVEDAATVADQRVRRAMHMNGGEQDQQERLQILRR